jgi:hypothetical protein
MLTSWPKAVSARYPEIAVTLALKGMAVMPSSDRSETPDGLRPGSPQ